MAGFIDALTFAYERETPPTRHIVFNLKRLDNPPQKINTAFLKQAGEFLAYRGVERVHLWTLERPLFGPLNLHILLHCPPSLANEFSSMEKGWAKRAGLPLKKGALHRKQIPEPIDSGAFLSSLESLGGYLLKGGDPQACNALGIHAVGQGTIYGKRCGWSQSIGKVAQERAGFRFKPSMRGALLFGCRYQLEARTNGEGSE
jgi:hypothetical protein